MCPQIESLGHEKLNKLLGGDKMEQLWELCIKRLSRYEVYLQTFSRALFFL